MTMERKKLRAAEWLYRWNLSMGIIGIVFTILTFMGVFTLILGPVLAQFGFTLLQTALLLLALVLAVVIGFGVFLDKVVRFWSAQATVGTVRNPYLVDVLYQKELLLLKYGHVPYLEAFLLLLREVPPSVDRDRLLATFETSLDRMKEAVRSKRWSIEAEERVY